MMATLYAAPMALLFVFLDDHGAAQGRGPESGSAALLGPVVVLILVVSAALVAALAGALGGLAGWFAQVSGRPLLGYGLAILGGVLVHQMRDQPGLRPWFEVILILVLPAMLAVWHGRVRAR